MANNSVREKTCRKKAKSLRTNPGTFTCGQSKCSGSRGQGGAQGENKQGSRTGTPRRSLPQGSLRLAVQSLAGAVITKPLVTNAAGWVAFTQKCLF